MIAYHTRYLLATACVGFAQLLLSNLLLGGNDFHLFFWVFDRQTAVQSPTLGMFQRFTISLGWILE